MNKLPLNPSELLKMFMHTDFTDINCIEEQSNKIKQTVIIKETLKKDITALQKNKAEFIGLLEKKQDLTNQLRELLNYRQSIDYDHKYKQIKFDHYQYPYRNSYVAKEELNNLRLQNLQKKKKIRTLQDEIKNQQKNIEAKRYQKENTALAFRRDNVVTRQNDCNQDFWLKRIQKIKNNFLNRQEDYKRAKIRHDYNLFVQKTNCDCIQEQTCPICSDYNINQVTSYRREAMLSPRYTSIYRKTKF